MEKHLYPVKVKTFRKFLKALGLNYNRTKGDHEIWSRKDLARPITFPIKNKEITPFIIKTNLNTLNIEVNQFIEYLEK